MKIAILCDDLIQHGGAEKIVEAISDIFPDAPVYTTVASNEWKDSLRKRDRKLVTSFLQKFPFIAKLNRFYSALNLHVLAIESFDFSEYDVVFSISSRYAHFAITNVGTKHICYLNTPGRMYWEPFDYFENEKYSGLVKFLLAPYLSFIRLADYAAMHRVDKVIANSIVTQKRLKKYFNIESDKINPFCPENIGPSKETSEKYYLILTRLVGWKKIEIAIRALNDAKSKLYIIGDGPDMSRLQSISTGNIVFLGRASEEVKWERLAGCKALIVTQKEDFGITMLEALSKGKPVIAFGKGGGKEILVENETGVFYPEQTPESLKDCIVNFEKLNFDSEKCKKRAEYYSWENFKCSILERVNEL